MDIGDLICDWRIPSEKMDLAPNTIHLWGVALKQTSVYAEELLQTLSPEEHAKATAIRFPKDRNCFVAGRGALRDILSRYHPQSAAELQFSCGPHGKPGLKPSPGAPPLSFNSSRSGEWGLIAVMRNHEVGIDVESIRPCEDYPTIAANFFSTSEIEFLNEHPGEPQIHAFLKCWTRKEAVSKALGTGLGLDWTSFDATLSPPERVEIKNNGVSKWSVYSFIVAPGFIGALAFDGAAPSFKFWSWPGPVFSRFSTQAGTVRAPFNEHSIHPDMPNGAVR